MLRTRLGRRPPARDFFWLGRALMGSGRTMEARLSLKEAQTRWFGADAGAAELAALEQTQQLAQVVERRP